MILGYRGCNRLYDERNVLFCSSDVDWDKYFNGMKWMMTYVFNHHKGIITCYFGGQKLVSLLNTGVGVKYITLEAMWLKIALGDYVDED